MRERLAEARNLLAEHRDERVLYWRLTGVREGPLEVGEDYGYPLMTHCGIEWARIGGAWWRTAPLSDGNANPPEGWGNPSQGGRLRIESDTTAVFTGGPEPITFERTEITAVDDPALPDSVRFCD